MDISRLVILGVRVMGLYTYIRTYVVIVKCILGMHFKMCVNPVYTLFCLFVDVCMYVRTCVLTSPTALGCFIS